MQTILAKRQLCPTGAGVSISPAIRKEMGLPNGDRFCAAEDCMAWRWEKGHEQPYEEQMIWCQLSESEFHRLANESTAIDDDEVREIIWECQGKVRRHILKQWNPTPPAGAGWRLCEKRWSEDNRQPHALFRRKRVGREGYCGVVQKQEDINSREAW